MILFGHPAGNPNSHQAALAHFESGHLEAFCVPWMPSKRATHWLERLGTKLPMASRLTRRHFAPLDGAPKIQGRLGEWHRLFTRALGRGDERLSYEANDWMMRTMTDACRRPSVTAVHAYEDCSLWQFEEAKRLGKACIYDMPIGYYPAWQQTHKALAQRYSDWLPAGEAVSSPYVRPEQKRQELALADLALVASSFVEKTVHEYFPDKKVARAAYGVDLDFWHPGEERPLQGPLRFIYAGQLSIRKGTPLLLQAWEKAGLRDAALDLVGQWHLADSKKVLPSGVTWHPPCSPKTLREYYRAADVFVFPSFFEGFGLVLLEAMACGMPAIASEATAAPDIMTEACGQVVPIGDMDTVVESLRWFAAHRDEIGVMRQAAREAAQRSTWKNYRRAVVEATAPYA